MHRVRTLLQRSLLLGSFRRCVFQVHGLSPSTPTLVTVDESCAAQRIDNFLTRHLKVPRAHVYKILKGEVKVNKKRVDFSYKLQNGDVVRIPPVRTPSIARMQQSSLLHNREFSVLYEDADFLAIDKPGDIAVHGGSAQETGVIECLRSQRPELSFLSLVHRLDKETSGVLLLSKSRAALNQVNSEGRFTKKYTVLVCGAWNLGPVYEARLHMQISREPKNGQRLRESHRAIGVVSAGETSKLSVSTFHLKKVWTHPTGAVFSLLEVHLGTGRTHQIRVQLAHLGFPVVKDVKYGIPSQGPNRLFLHAHSLAFQPRTGSQIEIVSPLPRDLASFMVNS